MAAPGLPVAKIEIEFTAGVWTDVTADVPMDPGVVITRGREDEFGTVSPTVLTFTLENIPATGTLIQKYTPDNPLSPYYPNMVEQKRVRVTYTHSAVDYVRGLVYVTAWQPNFPGGELNTATVTVSCVDIMGQFGQMKSDYAQQVLNDNPILGCELFLFTETGIPTSILNSGTGTGSLQIITPPGTSAALSTDTALNLEGVFTTTGIAGATANACKAPTLQGTSAVTINSNLEFWVKTSVSGGAVTFTLFDSFAGVEVDVLAVPSGTDLLLQFNGTSTITGTVPINDGNWHHVRLYGHGAILNGYQDDVSLGAFGSYIPSSWSIGGSLAGAGCLPSASYAGIAVQYDAGPFVSHYLYGLPNQLAAAQTRFAELAAHSPLAPTTTIVGTDNRSVIRKPTVGVNITDAMQELALTVGGFIWADPTGALTMIMSDAARTTTVAATITMESDDDASTPLTWKRAVDSIPKGVAVSSPLGNAFAGVTTGKQSSLTTCAATPTAALDAGNALVNASAKLRIAVLQVDLSTAQNDLYAVLLALRLGSRLRVAGLPSGAFGFTYEDVYAQGWVETLTKDAYTFTFDTTPADMPPDGLFDDATYGRFASDGATVTGGTCVGNTGTGTLIVATTNGSSPTWTTAGGDYPMDLDWAGERVTVSGVGGSSSPQTFTVTARGVAPSVARVHATGESLDVYDAACFAF